MFKRFLTILLSALTLLSSFCAFEAFAAENSAVSVVSAYYHDGFVSTYVKAKKPSKVSDTMLLAEINGKTSRDELFRQPNNSSSRVTYMFLIDASTSMPYYKERINAAATSLLKAENARSKKITVAVFGEKFKVIKADMTKSKKITETLNKIKYNHEATDISGGVKSAVKYLSSRISKQDEIVNLVVLTDGIPYIKNSKNPQEAIKKAAKKTKSVISKSHEVVIHTIGFGNWDANTIDALSAGTGLNLTATDNNSGIEAGKKIANFTDNLYMLTFPTSVSSSKKSLDVRFTSFIKGKKSGKTIKLKNITNVDYIPVKKASSTTQQKKTEPAKATEESTEKAKASDDEKPTKKPEKDDKNSGGGFPIIPIAIGAVTVLAIAAAIVIILLKKKPKQPQTSGIEMKLVVLSGKCSNKSDILYLRDELIVGRDKSCDICFDDPAVSQRNSRIFIEGAMIYIENISSSDNTAVGGMKIFNKNRLRSGDEITVGNSSFTLRF